MPDLKLNWEGNETLSPRGFYDHANSKEAKAKIFEPEVWSARVPAEAAKINLSNLTFSFSSPLINQTLIDNGSIIQSLDSGGIYLNMGYSNGIKRVDGQTIATCCYN